MEERQRRLVAAALDYERGVGLPSVVASGRGLVAERILELAFAAGVRVREDADLAEMLAAVDLGADIPAEAVVAVAEILAHVYRLNGTLDAAPAAS
jgi:flagellar biosynthesis protein